MKTDSKIISSLLEKSTYADLMKIPISRVVVVNQDQVGRLDLVLMDNGIDLNLMKYISIYNDLTPYKLYAGAAISIPDVSILKTRLTEIESINKNFEI